jgi:hypothetical protein
MISDEQFKNKLVAVLNKSIDTGKIMNALAHMCIGLGSAIDKEDLRLSNYKDADGGSHPFISEIPFIVLTENSNKIRKLRAEAISNHIIFNDFTDTMTIGTYKEQIEKTSLVKNENLVYYGIVLFGDWDKVTELTRKFSLWR